MNVAMKLSWTAATAMALVLTATAPSQAKVTAQEAAQLSTTLTPLGAIKAGNQDGSIPAWDGGVTTAPAGYQKGGPHVDPFAADQPLYEVTAANADKYKELLSPGQMAMLKRYPNTFKMKVYPTRRSAGFAKAIYDAVIQNAANAELTTDGNGIKNATRSIPFPIPKAGVETIWNHLTRYRGETTERSVKQVVPTPDGSFTPVQFSERVLWAYNRDGATIESINNRLAYFLQEVTAPARLAGTILLVHETLDQLAEPRNAWTYNPGQRRVRRAPNVAYDNPGTASDGQRTNDQLDMFNGAPDRYEWTLKGRVEMIVPYNTYKLDGAVPVADVVKAGHLNPDVVRYEKHRVWVTEANLRQGTSHVYAKRVFYFDEDSWQALVVDSYDGRGEIWRVSEAYPIQYYEMPLMWDTIHAHYDLQNGRYLAFGVKDKDDYVRFNTPMTDGDYSPESLRREGVR
ncbi:MAG: DUF1329 domain-containing protein [Rhodospirillaceae bacterium]|nr:DUF1329 domain-containing protein [Rhodospirillaceae bacterium]